MWSFGPLDLRRPFAGFFPQEVLRGTELRFGEVNWKTWKHRLPPFGETATVHGDAGPIMSSAVALMRLSKVEAVFFSSSCTGMMKVLKNLTNVDVFLCVYIYIYIYICIYTPSEAIHHIRIPNINLRHIP